MNQLRFMVRTGVVWLLFAHGVAACGGGSTGAGGGKSAGRAGGAGGPSSSATGTQATSAPTTSGSVPDAGPWDPATLAIPTSAFLVVDQFGYRTAAEKLAIAKSPVSGFDSGQSFAPSASLSVVDVHSGKEVATAPPVPWNGGAADSDTNHGSGDKTWWITFSSVKTAGTYVIVDKGNNMRSFPFQISDNVYASILRDAVRMLYYQRSGIAKDVKYAGAGWADDIAFAGDKTCTSYTSGGNPQDVSGGWFDAGDYNKYTSWAAGYVITLLRAYSENPKAFTDDYNIPESGNGVSDLVDEVRWEIDFLKRMQDGAGTTGGVFCVVGEKATAGGVTTPPSKFQGTCQYGDATTNATLNTAAAFAYASMVLGKIPSQATYASDLLSRAKKAWTWGQANPAVFFSNSGKVAAGEQEGGATAVPGAMLAAAAHLFAATADPTYKQYLDANYDTGKLTTNLAGYVGPWDVATYDALLTYATATGATAAVATAIKSNMLAGIKGGDNLPRFQSNADSYGAFLAQYVWGSNSTKGQQANVLMYVPVYQLDSTQSDMATQAAERFVHYFHGLNPLNEVYLTNEGGTGASKSVTKLFHSWFAPGTNWDTVGVSSYGPAPGYLVGGPNPSYALDGCCPSGCGSPANNALCILPSPPANQPPMKSYADFNGGWPVDSWAVTEPDCGYQSQYIRLLSKFVGI